MPAEVVFQEAAGPVTVAPGIFGKGALHPLRPVVPDVGVGNVLVPDQVNGVLKVLVLPQAQAEDHWRNTKAQSPAGLWSGSSGRTSFLQVFPLPGLALPRD